MSSTSPHLASQSRSYWPALLLSLLLFSWVHHAHAQEEPSPTPPAADPSDDDDDDSSAEAAPLVAPRDPLDPLPNIPLSSALLSKVLTAELTAQRGNWDLAVKQYVQLANETRDPRLIRRGLQAASAGNRNAEALTLSKLWADISPQNPLAHLEFGYRLLQNKQWPQPLQPLKTFLKLPLSNGTSLENSPADVDNPEFNGRIMELINLATLLQDLPDSDNASRQFADLFKPYDRIATAHYAQALIYHRNGDDVAANKEVQRALVIRPDWRQGVLLAATVGSQQNPAAALETVRQYLANHKGDDEMHLFYIRLLADSGQDELARKEISSLATTQNLAVAQGLAALATDIGDHEQAARLYQKLQFSGVGDSSVYAMSLGRLAEGRKDNDEAVRQYQSITSGSQFILAQIRLSVIQARQGHGTDALARLDKLLKDRPESRTLLLTGQAEVLQTMQQPQKAYDLLNAEITRDPDNISLRYEASLYAEKIKRIDLLEQHLRYIIKLDPKFFQAYNALGYTLADNNMRLSEAKDLVATALRLNPDEPAVLDSMGWVLYRQNKPKEALPYLQRAFNRQKDPEIAAHLTEVLWALGQRQQAIDHLRTAAKLFPDDEKLLAIGAKLGISTSSNP